LQQCQQHALPSLQNNALLLEVKFTSIVKTIHKTKQSIFSFDLQFLVLSVSHGAVNYEGCRGRIRKQTQQNPATAVDDTHELQNVPNSFTVVCRCFYYVIFTQRVRRRFTSGYIICFLDCEAV
jgi:hypothetical protein